MAKPGGGPIPIARGTDKVDSLRAELRSAIDEAFANTVRVLVEGGTDEFEAFRIAIRIEEIVKGKVDEAFRGELRDE